MSRQIEERWARTACYSMLTTACLLGGCDNSGSDISSTEVVRASGSNVPSSPQLARPSPGGIWHGVDAAGNETLAFITEDGLFQFVADSRGRYQTSGFVGNFCAEGCFSPNRVLMSSDEFGVEKNTFLSFGGFLFPDPSSLEPRPGYDGMCGIEGVLEERSTIRGDFHCEFIHGSEPVGIVFSYDDLYEVDSDSSRFVGHWTDSDEPGSDVISIDALGRVTGQDGGGSNCVYSGAVSVIDPEYNLYGMHLVYSACTGDAALLNGTEFSGYSTIDETVDPTSFTLLAIGHREGRGISLARTFQQM